MKDDQIKDAFKRAKNDIDFLGSEISQIKQEIREIKHFLDEFANFWYHFFSNQKLSVAAFLISTY